MILEFKSRFNEYHDLLEILEDCNIDDFYLTENNQRIYINNLKNLKKLFSNSKHVFYECEKDRKGIILIWKGFGGETSRNYLKIIANNQETAKGLLTMLLWNFNDQVFTKIKKDSFLINVLKSKGFRFVGGRGTQILLSKEKFVGR